MRRRILQALLATVLVGVGGLFAAQPAYASVTVPAGKSGSVCSEYKYVSTILYYQSCAWTSWNPPSSRTWFTAHFGNNSDNIAAVRLTRGYYIAGAWHSCGEETIMMSPHSVAATEAGECWLPRGRAAVQAAMRFQGELLSPTLQILG